MTLPELKTRPSPNFGLIAVKLRQLNRLFIEVRDYKAAHPETKIGYYTSSVGSILNAYREGDLSFDECCGLLTIAPEVVAST